MKPFMNPIGGRDHRTELYAAVRTKTDRPSDTVGEEVWIGICSCGWIEVQPMERVIYDPCAEHLEHERELERREKERSADRRCWDEEDKVPCPECGKRFKPAGLKLHIQMVHALRVHGCVICDEIESICRPGVEFTSESEFAILRIGKQLSSQAQPSRIARLQAVRMHLLRDGRRDVSSVLTGLMKSPERRGEFLSIGESDA